MKKQDREEFEAYLENCSDAQVLGVLQKESDAKRYDYAHLARLEAIKRGLM